MPYLDIRRTNGSRLWQRGLLNKVRFRLFKAMPSRVLMLPLPLVVIYTYIHPKDIVVMLVCCRCSLTKRRGRPLAHGDSVSKVKPKAEANMNTCGPL